MSARTTNFHTLAPSGPRQSPHAHEVCVPRLCPTLLVLGSSGHDAVCVEFGAVRGLSWASARPQEQCGL